ncbi:ATP-binding cassette domain-containing protein [Aestuariibius sp. HNIBRBA575]|uniref:ATP-binding cassette domain-containing protein n=1 Tax=Aestuariibius sp. HNIBRBA575 TaxID=3233343 RepID=UPI0034A2E2F0
MVSELFPLVATGASTKRRGKTLVGPVDFTLLGTGATMVIGPNGSGKTSLLRMLHGIARLGSGTIDWACPTSDAQSQQAFVFQHPVMMRRSVLANLTYPLQLNKTPRKQARDLAAQWAQRIGLDMALDQSATSLSGGERQKLALARALIRNPKVLFLDEPCASLDGRATREIETILIEAMENGTRLIMSTHDMGQAARLANDVLFLLHGNVLEHSAAKDFFAAPKTDAARAFLKGDIVE